MNTLSKIRFSIVFNWRKRNNSIIEKPIHIRATQHRKTIYLPTGIEVAPNQWSKKNKRIVDHPLADIFNKKLYDQLFEVEAYEMQLVRQEKGEWIPVELIKEYRNADNTGFRNFNEFCQYELEHSTIKPNTKRTQKSHLKLFFTAFKKDKPVYFREVNVSLVKRFDRFVKSLEAVNSQNTVWGYHKTLKTYINRAIGEELIKENPYDTYKVKRERDENVKRTWLTLEEMQRIEQLTFTEEKQYLKPIQQFFLICLWCGFRFSTTVSLLPSDIRATKDGLVILKLKIAKSNKRVFMPLYLLGEKGADGLTKPERLFQTLLDQRAKDTDGQTESFKEIPFFSYSLQHINRELKVLAKLANINKNLTSHCGRRTFIDVMAKDFGLPLPLVQQLVQHSDIKTTMKYINQSDEDIIKELKRVDIQF